MADKQLMHDTLAPIGITVLIEGEAKGADSLARNWAIANKIKLLMFPAQWNKYGKAAGPIRNKQMLVEGKPELVVAFLAPHSIGTRNMIAQARAANVRTIVIDL